VQLDGIFYVFAPLPHQAHSDAGLLADFTHGRLVGQLVPFDMLLNLHISLDCITPHGLLARAPKWR
jgi:hypothetical protein